MTKVIFDLSTRRHSCAHLLAAAVQQLWPEVKLAIGPAIAEGFYYDFDLEHKFSEEDLAKIEKVMVEIQKKNLAYEHSDLPIIKAIEQVRQQGQIYKTELAEELKLAGETKVSFYRTGDFLDLCKGPHVAKTKEVGVFKLLSVAGAYWRGDEKNKMLQRIYGTCFVTKEELRDYLKLQEEIKERDHRKIGKDLGLFVFSELVGKGLPLFTPKGTVIRRELEKFVIEEETKRGYQHVMTPALAKTELYKISGHYPYYKETMYPAMTVDEEELILRPMTCPHHFMLYKSALHSYRELPLRIAELASQFRYEKSGELSGLMRLRMFNLADAHIFAMPNQIPSVIKEVLELIDYINKIFGLIKGVDYRYRLSLGDRQDEKKYYKDPAAWERAEKVLRQVLQEIEAPFVEATGEAAFYGPKIDVQVKKVNGKEETAFTVQYDFVMPKRFNLTYVDERGKEQEVVVIHRSSLGAFERTIAFLIEKYSGAFPVWLSPVQAQIITVSEKFDIYAKQVLQQLQELGIRAEVDQSNESLGKKIRKAETQKIPYILVVGEKEEKAASVGVRKRQQGDLGLMSLAKFISLIKQEINDKVL